MKKEELDLKISTLHFKSDLIEMALGLFCRVMFTVWEMTLYVLFIFLTSMFVVA